MTNHHQSDSTVVLLRVVTLPDKADPSPPSAQGTRDRVRDDTRFFTGISPIPRGVPAGLWGGLAADANLRKAENDATTGSGASEAQLRPVTREKYDLVQLPAHGRVHLPGENAVVNGLSVGID